MFLIISDCSVLLEDIQKHCRYGLPRTKTCHEENISLLKFLQMLLQFGRRVSKPWWRPPLEKNCCFFFFDFVAFFDVWGVKGVLEMILSHI